MAPDVLGRRAKTHASGCESRSKFDRSKKKNGFLILSKHSESDRYALVNFKIQLVLVNIRIFLSLICISRTHSAENKLNTCICLRTAHARKHSRTQLAIIWTSARDRIVAFEKQNRPPYNLPIKFQRQAPGPMRFDRFRKRNKVSRRRHALKSWYPNGHRRFYTLRFYCIKHLLSIQAVLMLQK